MVTTRQMADPTQLSPLTPIGEVCPPFWLEAGRVRGRRTPAAAGLGHLHRERTEITMTARSYLRLGPDLLGITCLDVSLGVAASASASSHSSAKRGDDKVARMAGSPY
jgi:hypothetical protein